MKSHVLHNVVPGYVECNKNENILTWERFMHPRVTFAVSMNKMIPSECSIHMVKALVEVYAKQKYILFPNQNVGATSMSVLKSLWHVHWLNEHPNNNEDQVLNWLKESLPKLEEGFSEFIEQPEIAGWEKDQIALKMP